MEAYPDRDVPRDAFIVPVFSCDEYQLNPTSSCTVNRAYPMQPTKKSESLRQPELEPLPLLLLRCELWGSWWLSDSNPRVGYRIAV